MGNRYGRNQRRKARERIAGLESALFQEEQLRKHLRTKIDRQHEALSTVAEILGPNFVGLESRHMQDSGNFRDIYNMSLGVPFSRAVQAWDSGALAAAVHESVVRLNAVSFDRRREELRSAMHLMVTFKDKRAGYFVSDMALINTPKYIFIRNVSTVLAREIAEQVYNKLREPITED